MNRQSKQYPANIARTHAGYTLGEAAKLAQVSEGYLRRVEREGAPFLLARRLSRLYDCPIQVFLPIRREEG